MPPPKIPAPCRSLRAFAAVLVPCIMLAGCTHMGYYGQAIGGHLEVMAESRPVQDVLADAATPLALRERLMLSQRIRDFAVAELALPDNASYRRYADLKRRAVVWNVVAAPALSLELQRWCFAVAGCVNYRGYFSPDAARQQAQQLRAQGLDVAVFSVPAYSTLGWLNWLGGDPLLNTFIDYPEGELARLIFHELAHQVVYVEDDSTFNESFATAVERMGVAHWLRGQASVPARQAYEAFDARRRQFGDLVRRTRERLAALYAGQQGEPTLAAKAEVIAEFQRSHARIKQAWPAHAGHDALVAQANNALFGAFATYDELVPGFMVLFEQEGQAWPRFFAAVHRLAKAPREQRRQTLQTLAAGRPLAHSRAEH